MVKDEGEELSSVIMKAMKNSLSSYEHKEASSAKIVKLTLHTSDYEDIYSHEIATKSKA